MEDVPVELYREFMSDISEEIDRESQIIEDLLTLVKLDKSEAELNVTQINVNDLLWNRDGNHCCITGNDFRCGGYASVTGRNGNQ